MIRSLQQEMNRIIAEGWTDGISVAWGSPNKNRILCCGSKSGSPSLPISDKTIYDLASVTKIFTLMSVLKLVETGIISLTAQIGDYSNKFPNIKHLHIYELMNFSKHIFTKNRLDSFNSTPEAIASLYNAECDEESGIYSDIGAIILGLLIDSMPGLSLEDAVNDMINSCHLKNTYWWTAFPNSELNQLQSYDHEYYLSNGKYIEKQHALGVPHDKKAEIIGVSGHAGLFSTPKDIALFASAILSHEVISEESLAQICSPHYDYHTNDGQHFGLLCYKKTSNSVISEIPVQFSNSAFAISGYTGTYLLIDPGNNYFVSVNSNRVYNRCPSSEDNISPTIKGTKSYVYRKDLILSQIYPSTS